MHIESLQNRKHRQYYVTFHETAYTNCIKNNFPCPSQTFYFALTEYVTNEPCHGAFSYRTITDSVYPNHSFRLSKTESYLTKVVLKFTETAQSQQKILRLIHGDAIRKVSLTRSVTCSGYRERVNEKRRSHEDGRKGGHTLTRGYSGEVRSSRR